ncbi:hypothetical protein CBR_g12031 [Chara braunii]|uniref:Translation initiation factor IF-2, mitochondrial n=1 Tax=Chara braunii TaxID=69332 RepID=A0A388KQZ2_CHABU|nr:hypothetical protein CBR_g12031 [Chara braunii]|eukprot:GBG72457.1 hypothetical protein CBR_g12031 [Chara braunii]
MGMSRWKRLLRLASSTLRSSGYSRDQRWRCTNDVSSSESLKIRTGQCRQICSSSSSSSSVSSLTEPRFNRRGLLGEKDAGSYGGRRLYNADSLYTQYSNSKGGGGRGAGGGGGRPKFPAGAPTPKYRPQRQQQAEQQAQKQQPRPKAAPVEAPYKPGRPRVLPPKRKEVQIADQVSLRQLAQLMGAKLDALEAAMGALGEQVSSADQIVSADVAELLALEFGFTVRRVRSRVVDAKRQQVLADSKEAVSWPTRSPVVTVMGHVDHGKTSLLDALRRTSIAAKEAGGITQHMGAFMVQMPSASASLTFIDTPGHAAFSAMRARGAAVTDIVVLVVAADDGVMPQTREALAHARAARVPIVVAINKCDKPGADPKRVRQQLIEEGVELEEIGGEVQVVEVSATECRGLDKLEEALLLQGEMMDLRARVSGEAEGVVVEARLDKGQGALATTIIQAGTLVPGSHVVVGTQWGRVRRLRDMTGRVIESAGPSMPVEIDGLKGVPEAGDELLVVGGEERARKVSDMRKQRKEEERLRKMSERWSSPPPHDHHPKRASASSSGVEGDNDDDTSAENDSSSQDHTVQVPLIVKADVRGTAEAVREAVQNLSGPGVHVNVVHTGVGPICQSDVALAEACEACIIGFNVRSAGAAVDSAARRASVVITQDQVIYRLLESVGKMVVGKMPGMNEEKIAGEAQVLQLFEVKGKGSAPSTAVAGCKVIDGRLQRNARIRVLRSGEKMFEGPCRSLRRDKLDVETVGKGTECGMILADWNDYCVGDVVQCIEQVMRPAKLVSTSDGMMHIEV